MQKNTVKFWEYLNLFASKILNHRNQFWIQYNEIIRNEKRKKRIQSIEINEWEEKQRANEAHDIDNIIFNFQSRFLFLQIDAL